MRNPISAVTVEKPSVGNPTLLSIREHTLGRNPITVPNARKVLVETHYLLNTREFIPEKDLISVVSVGRHLD